MDVPTIKNLLEKYHVSPLKSRGQHFLINGSALAQVINIASVNTYDTILEIGPGLGVLTRELALRAKNVIAVEIDKGFTLILDAMFASQAHVQIVHDDILQFPLASLKTYKVVGNLPYNIAAQILEKFLGERVDRPSSLTITIQKEFALRLCAKAGSMNRLGLLAQYYSKPKIISHFPPHYFWPQPKVYSTLVHTELIPANQLPLSVKQEQELWRLVRTAFQQPRKKLRNSLGLDNIFSERRPEELSVEEWIQMMKLG